MAISVDLDEVAHDEPPRRDLRRLQIQLISTLVLHSLNTRHENKQLNLQTAGVGEGNGGS